MQIQKVSFGLLLITCLWLWGVAEGHAVQRQGVLLVSPDTKSVQPLFLQGEILERLARLESKLPEANKDTPKAKEKTGAKEGVAVEEHVRGHQHLDGSSTGVDVANRVGFRFDVKYPVISFLSDNLEKVFGKLTDIRWKDWKLWVGILAWSAVWGYWFLHGFWETWIIRFVFTFGINILIFHVLQYEHTTRLALAEICGFLAAQGMFHSWYLWYQRVEEKMTAFECDTMYMDVSLPWYQILVLFLAQICVWWFYMTSIIANINLNDVNYLFWFAAFMVMQITMIFNRGDDSALGNAFPFSQWLYMVKRTDMLAFKLRLDEDDSGLKHNDSVIFKETLADVPFRVSKASLIMRGVSGFFVNTILREIMAYTIPLMMMGFHEPMNFVVYCVGVNFICTLDDMKEKTFNVKELDNLEKWNYENTPPPLSTVPEDLEEEADHTEEAP